MGFITINSLADLVRLQDKKIFVILTDESKFFTGYVSSLEKDAANPNHAVVSFRPCVSFDTALGQVDMPKTLTVYYTPEESPWKITDDYESHGLTNRIVQKKLLETKLNPKVYLNNFRSYLLSARTLSKV